MDFLLIFCRVQVKIKITKQLIGRDLLMADEYGSDFITIVDEDGTEFELEVLTSIEYNGDTYLAVTLAGAEDEDLEISILKSVEEEEGDPILCAVEDEIELETVYNLIMDQIYEEEDE